MMSRFISSDFSLKIDVLFNYKEVTKLREYLPEHCQVIFPLHPLLGLGFENVNKHLKTV